MFCLKLVLLEAVKKSSIFGNIKESMTISKTKTKRDTKKSSISKKIKESMTFSKYNIKKYNIIKKSNYFFLSPYTNPQSGTSILFAPYIKWNTLALAVKSIGNRPNAFWAGASGQF